MIETLSSHEGVFREELGDLNGTGPKSSHGLSGTAVDTLCFVLSSGSLLPQLE